MTRITLICGYAVWMWVASSRPDMIGMRISVMTIWGCSFSMHSMAFSAFSAVKRR